MKSEAGVAAGSAPNKKSGKRGDSRAPPGFELIPSSENAARKSAVKGQAWLFRVPVDFDPKELDGQTLDLAQPTSLDHNSGNVQLAPVPLTAANEASQAICLWGVDDERGLVVGRPFQGMLEATWAFDVPTPTAGPLDESHVPQPQGLKQRWKPIGSATPSPSMAQNEGAAKKKKKRKSKELNNDDTSQSNAEEITASASPIQVKKKKREKKSTVDGKKKKKIIS